MCPVSYTHLIAIVRSTGGKVEGPTQVLAGEDATFTITADENYFLEDVLVDGVSVGQVTEYKMCIRDRLNTEIR